MAGSIGRFTAALASVTNEFSASLVTVNLDFAIVKKSAPAEFTAIAKTISPKRKVEAEDGRLHKTARRLGLLFENQLPNTDELYRAYGTRVSEICSVTAEKDPGGTHKDGIFGGHIGIDATSIWAAATSGSSSIGAHLLACMLARIFTGSEATSIWVELVQKQKEWIRQKKKDSLFTEEHENASLAAQQDITRDDLSHWDASARAWLLSADEAKKLQHTQTRLILENTNLPVNSEPQTFKSVIKAWTAALEAMSNLVKGIPQRAPDGAVLLAISAWHMYPDMVVYGESCVRVSQKDALFESTTLLTVGLQQVANDSRSVYWSLPLACLQHYGDPVQVSRTVGQDNSRITCEEFSYVILGCLFAGWRNFARTNDEGLTRLECLFRKLDPFLAPESLPKPRIEWLSYVSSAMESYSKCDETKRLSAQKLMQLGRRYSKFIMSSVKFSSPFFGLARIGSLLQCIGDSEARVRFLRHLSTDIGLKETHFIIKYRVFPDNERWIECASIAPLKNPSSISGHSAANKHTRDGEPKGEEAGSKKNVRWHCLSRRQVYMCIRRHEYLVDIPGAIRKKEEITSFLNSRGLRVPGSTSISIRDILEQSECPLTQTELAQGLQEIDELEEIIVIARRAHACSQMGEIFLPMLNRMSHRPHEEENHVGLQSRVPWYSYSQWPISFLEACHELAEYSTTGKVSLAIKTPVMMHYAGEPDHAAILTFDHLSKCLPEHLSQEFAVCPTLFDYTLNYEKDWNVSDVSQLFGPSNESYPEVICLAALASMKRVYDLLPGATISTTVLKSSLIAADWVSGRNDTGLTLSREQAFACIAMFETGICIADTNALKEVFAMSSGNSLYISASLLGDPSKLSEDFEICRVMGNVGRAGVTFLISPPEVRIREADPTQWMTISHNLFDGELESHFRDTSIHLSFTDYVIPLVTDDNRYHKIDQEVVMVEALVSVYEGQRWVGEIDILKTFSDPAKYALLKKDEIHHQVTCKTNDGLQNYERALAVSNHFAATSIDNWDELIESPPHGSIVVRAHKVWLARLAATALCVKLGFHPLIICGDICWNCYAAVVQNHTRKSYCQKAKKRFAFIL